MKFMFDLQGELTDEANQFLQDQEGKIIDLMVQDSIRFHEAMQSFFEIAIPPLTSTRLHCIALEMVLERMESAQTQMEDEVFAKLEAKKSQ